jgi:predicted ATP-dependent serine protease
VVKKPLPFKSNWKSVGDGGNIYHSDNWESIIKAMQKTTREIIVIDDLQYLLANEFMSRAHEKGYEKFTEMARHYFDVVTAATHLPDYKRVYLLSHTDVSEQGQVKAKTIGKLLDEKITIEGLLTIVLRTHVINGQYVFSTKNSGSDTVKTPIGLFDDDHIDNDLLAVDKAIKEYYDLKQAA